MCRGGFLSIKLNLKRVGESDWVETRAWNHKGALKGQLSKEYPGYESSYCVI